MPCREMTSHTPMCLSRDRQLRTFLLSLSVSIDARRDKIDKKQHRNDEELDKRAEIPLQGQKYD